MNNDFPPKIFGTGYNSRVLELSLTFISSFENVRYEHSLKQPMQTIELKSNQIFYKNPKFIQKVNHQNSSHPLIREYTREPMDDKNLLTI